VNRDPASVHTDGHAGPPALSDRLGTGAFPSHAPAQPLDTKTVMARIERSIGFDWHIVIPTLALAVFGLVMIYSTGGRGYFIRQLIWFPIAIIVMFVCYRTPRRIIYALAYPMFAASILLLLAVLVLGHGPAHRWFSLGPMNFQPSELAKLAGVIALARYISDIKPIEFRIKDLLVPMLLTLIPFLLVLIEPDLGSSMVFLPILAVMLYWNGMRPFYLFLLFAPLLSLIASFHIVSWIVYFVLLTVLLLWRGRMWERIYGFVVNVLVGLLTPAVLNHMHDYQKARMTTFLMPWLDPKGMGWNVVQSLIAVGSGRWVGKGLLAGTQKRLNFLPNRHTDFIFSCVGEEFGFIGSLLVIAAFCYLVYRFMLTAYKTKDYFGGMMVMGLTAIFAYHAIVNSAMILGLAPITGIALPFLTYGGSPLLMNFAIVGLILNVRYRPE
jgi:rod shape determining protein RodA